MPSDPPPIPSGPEAAPHRSSCPHPSALVRMSRMDCLLTLSRAMPAAVWQTATQAPALIGVAAAFITDPRSSSDAVLILADRLREAADDAENRRYVRDGAYLRFLEDVMRSAAPFMRGGEPRP